jgi:hypothetical protein
MTTNSTFGVVYFVYFAGLSAVHPFLALFLKEQLSAPLVGILLLVKPLVGVVGGAVLCGFADQRRCHRFVLLVSTVISAMAMQGLWWWSPGGGFRRFLVLFSVIGFFSAPVSSIVDSLCAHNIKDSGCKETYGQIRLWGAAGWGAFAAVAAFLVERSSSWAPAFYIHGIFSMATLFACYRVATHVSFRREHGADERTFVEKLNRLMADAGFGSFILLCVVFGTTTGAIEGFLFPFLATLPGATETLYGISLSVTCFSESLVFWKAAPLMRWIEGGWGRKRLFHGFRGAAARVHGHEAHRRQRVGGLAHRASARSHLCVDVDLVDRRGSNVRIAHEPGVFLCRRGHISHVWLRIRTRWLRRGGRVRCVAGDCVLAESLCFVFGLVRISSPEASRCDFW